MTAQDMDCLVIAFFSLIAGIGIGLLLSAMLDSKSDTGKET